MPIAHYEWLTDPVPDGMPVRQVYGFCFHESGRVLLREDGGNFSLPGGRPEEYELTWAEVLHRECTEECQIKINHPLYLGYQKVTEDGAKHPYAQVRMVANIIHFSSPSPDPDTGRTYRRMLAPIADAPALLNWGVTGLLQCAAAAKVAMSTLKFDVDVRSRLYHE